MSKAVSTSPLRVVAALAFALTGAGCVGEGPGGPSFLPPVTDLPPADTGPTKVYEPASAVYVDDASALDGTAPKLVLTMVDVGQGDGLLLRLPSGKLVAIDGGPDRTGAFSTLLTGPVDSVFLSHAHSDHYTGLPAAVAKFPGGAADCTKRAFDPGYDRLDIAGYKYFRDTAGCRYQALGQGMSMNLDPEVSFEVLGAATQPFPTVDGTGINNTSLVIRVRYRGFALLLTGDAQTEAEQLIYNAAAAASADRASLRANVLKVGHHGSCNATGTSWLRAVRPSHALISLAPYDPDPMKSDNTFGHPHCQTLGKLRAQGTHWLRTDKNGSITVVTDGERYTVSAARTGLDVADCPRDCAMPTDF